jgi:hypothetical protein
MVNIISKIYSNPSRATELFGLDEWVYDLILKPLLLAVELESTRSEAASAYRSLCSVLERGELRREVPVYLSVLDAVEHQGKHVSSTVSAHRMALYDAGQNQKLSLAAQNSNQNTARLSNYLSNPEQTD